MAGQKSVLFSHFFLNWRDLELRLQQTETSDSG